MQTSHNTAINFYSSKKKFLIAFTFEEAIADNFFVIHDLDFLKPMLQE